VNFLHKSATFGHGWHAPRLVQSNQLNEPRLRYSIPCICFCERSAGSEPLTAARHNFIFDLGTKLDQKMPPEQKGPEFNLSGPF